MSSDPAAVCSHVAEGEAPILYAARAREGAPEWLFRCERAPHDVEDERLSSLEEVVGRDPSTVEIALHPRGTVLARASVGGRWHVKEGTLPLPGRPSRRWPSLDPRFAPRRGEPLDARDLRVLADVAEVGWHVVQAVETGRSHAFTIGLFRSFDHPEVVLFGFGPEIREAALDRLGARVRAGERFEDGGVADGILADRPVTFRVVARRHYLAYLGYAGWYHGGPRFPALQAVWPDAEGRFPWERWFSPALREAEPILSELEPA
ncbi:DUF4262 domain-containing protein [Anaeromyxobacter sp. Fw109-5]|uniref:DUF4262 domain-containing protein n=1 Tax=Anaeromyxobacter sp. (strain Fw109-5) TaxID=404589 RepID=UPI0000ED7338|nr:DUF4262 domain-containing protein [Anaeromyxobacter sp. Fw109-5]ABS26806.1 hypothetical protein Anae109_2605 [Anaeromyxobacter sp. Fw109-5]